MIEMIENQVYLAQGAYAKVIGRSEGLLALCEGMHYVLIRYAEVLLTYAEAMNNLNPLCQEAFDAVNKVRARVGMPALQKTDASKPTYCGTQADLLKRIKNEWRVEFALEGDIRKWNLRRWGDAKEVLNRKYHSMVWTLNGENFTPYVGTEHVELPGSKYSDHNYIYPDSVPPLCS